MNVIETEIPDVKLIEPRVFGDERGYFFEVFSRKNFDEALGRIIFVQNNESSSAYGVLRGLHYQVSPHAQAKLVRVVSGEVLDVAVDIRPDSPTYGKYVKFILSGENKMAAFIPHGFAHGFVVRSERAIFSYYCDNYYCPEAEGSVRFDDPAIGIDWEFDLSKAILSGKDKVAPLLKDARPYS